MALHLYIQKATYVGGLALELRFNDGTANVVDFSNFFLKNPHPQYNKYKEERNFKKFSIVDGNVVWGKNWDLIFPIEQLYSGEIV